MIITNKQKLPEAIVKAVTPEYHNAENSYSATTLIKGVKEIILTKRHWDKITIDCSELVNAIIGTAFHSIMEKNAEPDKVEIPVSFNFENLPSVTGKIDFYDESEKLIVDWKTATTWKIINRDFDDWHTQGLIYAYLLSKAGKVVEKCSFTAYLKDFSPAKAETDSSYPQQSIYVYEFAVTPKDIKDIEFTLMSKLNSIIANETLEDDSIAACSAKERWETEPSYAVVSKTRKSAIKLCKSMDEAKAYIDLKLNGKPGIDIEYRPGISKKCLRYCPCKEFCSFYKSIKESSDAA